MYRGTPLIINNPPRWPLQQPYASRGTYGDPMGVGVSYERGTPVLLPLSTKATCTLTWSHASSTFLEQKTTLKDFSFLRNPASCSKNNKNACKPYAASRGEKETI